MHRHHSRRPRQRLHAPARPTWWLAASVAAASGLGALHGCGSSEQGSDFRDPPVDAATPPVDGTTRPISDAAGSDSDIFASGPYSDFPAPIFDSPDGGLGVPANPDKLFENGAAASDAAVSDGGAGSGPCLLEPDIGSLYPRNWLRPRFRWAAAGGETLFELRAHVANQKQDLVVYTTATSWTMPKAMWDGLRQHSNDLPITVSIRGGVVDGAVLRNVAMGSKGDIGIAPVDAPGTIVYWTTTGVSQLKGFSVGDESVSAVLVPSQVQIRGQGKVECIGCHASTPDGKSVGFAVGPSGYTNGIAIIEPDAGVGNVPSYVTPAAATALASLTGIPAFSKGHWATGDRTMILSHTGSLTWVDLEAADAAAVQGVVARGGDLGKAVAPSWSHDGASLAYGSTTGQIVDGRPASGPSDLYVVPYGNRAGGTATKVPGASDPAFDEYYPSYSPNDALVVYNRVASNVDQYNAATAEVFVVPPGAGKATRLTANDPPVCSGKTSPGVTNSWPHWAPEVAVSKGRTYYWVVFSTTRDGFARDNRPVNQLYIAPVIVDGTGAVTTYKALYLWNQPSDEANHTPAWDTFKIPSPPIPR